MAEKVFTLPDLGEGLTSAEISRWLVAVGDEVKLNQPLVEVNTEKALVEIPSPVAGTIAKLHADDGDEVDVGSPLATFTVAEPASGSEEKPPPEPRAARKAVLVGYGVDTDVAKSIKGGLRMPGRRAARRKPLSTPAVRKLAKDLGVDLSVVAGSGPEGRVMREDVESAVRTQVNAPVAAVVVDLPGDERVAVRGVRKLIAERMHAAWTQAPHVTTYLTVDCTAVNAFRREISAGNSMRLTSLPIIVCALAQVCRDHPRINAAWDAASSEIVLRSSVHAGIATATEDGLVVPVVRDVQSKTVLKVGQEMADAVEAVRTRRAPRELLSGSTITVSNVGSFGAEYGTPILNLPEVAILAVGVTEARPRVVGNEVRVRQCTTMSLSFDHRALDGAEAGWALAELREYLEDPQLLRSLPS